VLQASQLRTSSRRPPQAARRQDTLSGALPNAMDSSSAAPVVTRRGSRPRTT
jgi:hypothetical protein